MVISEDKHPYYDGTQAATAPDLYYDLQSIMTHEFGHAAGLDHVNTTTQVMYCCFGNRTSNPNTHVRDQVLQDERDGMRWLYESNYNWTHPAGMGPWEPAPSGHYDDANKFVGYKGTTWSANTNLTNPRYPQDNTLTWANSVGATTWFQANTNRITWQYTKHNLRGFAEVYIDGNYQGTYNLDDDDDTIWRVRRTWEFPSIANHVIEVRNATVSDYIDADAFIAGIGYFSQGTYENSTPGLGYFGTWTHNTTCCSWASGGNLSWSNIADNGVTFTFKGSAITYRFTKAYNRGKVKITTDGEFQEVIDLYADPPNGPNNCRCLPMQTKTYYFPNNGVHTINITVTGDKNTLAADRFVDIDTLIVLP